ncbi:MAG TPA: DMT family transporter [Planktothrix sp.]|jgi:drug/metabolite transporter (DMT)-like permease
MSWKIDRGLVAALLAPFFIALSIILTKMAGSLAQPLVISALGSLIAVPCLFTLQLILRKPIEWKLLLTRLRLPFVKVLVTRSIIGQVLIITGFTLTSAVKAVLLLRLEPLFVFGWSLLFHKEQPHAQKLILLSVLILGSLLVVAPQGAVAGPNVGDALVVASLFFLSYSYFPTQEVMAEASSGALNILTCLIGGLVLAVALLCTGSASAFQLSSKALALIASYSVVFFLIAATLYYYAFKTLKPWVIASFLSLEVVFGLLLACFMLHETMTALQIAGATIVLAATAAIGRLKPTSADKQSTI